MKALNEEDLALNRSGTLTKEQLWVIKSKGVINLIAGLCFLVMIPLAIFAAKIKWGAVLYIWIAVAVLLGSVFLWLAKTYIFIKKDGHEIQSISGVIEKKNSGNKNVILKIGERSFFLRKNDVEAMKEGKEYTVYFIDDPKFPLGYVLKVN